MKGPMYPQTNFDCHSRYGWTRLYPKKLPVAVVHQMSQDVVGTFEAPRACMEAVLPECGQKFFELPNGHLYELYVEIEEFEQHTMQVNRPKSSGPVKLFYPTSRTEHFRVEGPSTWFKPMVDMHEMFYQYFVEPIHNRSRIAQCINRRIQSPAFQGSLPSVLKTHGVSERDDRKIIRWIHSRIAGQSRRSQVTIFAP